MLHIIQLRCERFIEELENYAKQVEEFDAYGDIQEVNRYLKKAQVLNSKLEQAIEKVSVVLIVSSVKNQIPNR